MLCVWCSTEGPTTLSTRVGGQERELCKPCIDQHTYQPDELIVTKALCEAGSFTPRPGVLYRFLPLPKCAECATAAAVYN